MISSCARLNSTPIYTPPSFAIISTTKILEYLYLDKNVGFGKLQFL